MTLNRTYEVLKAVTSVSEVVTPGEALNRTYEVLKVGKFADCTTSTAFSESHL